MLKGTIDRLIKIGNIFRIIDFKTGNVESREIKISDTARFAKEKYSAKAIQLLIYSWLLQASRQIPDTSDLEVGIISFRRLNHGFLPLCVAENKIVNEEFINLITNILTEVLLELFDPEIPFAVSDNPEDYMFSQFGVLY